MSDSDLPLVSALTPVYNYGRYLPRTLDSALEQDYPANRLEIVIVDDGSTDETPDVIAEYQAKHPGRIRAFHQENQGFIAATNATFREARGELWAFLDSDDVWPREKTREQVRIMRRRPEVGVVYSDTQLIDPYGKVLESSVWELYKQKPIVGGGGDAVYKMCSEQTGNPALNSSIMLRAKLAERFAPIPDGVPYVDWWVVARLAQVSELATSASLVGYRTHGANITLGATGRRAVREVLKTVEMRRQLLLRGAAEDLTTEQLLKIWRVFEEGAILAARIANTVFLPVAQATGAEVEKGRAYAAEAEADTRAGRYGDALRNRVMAVVANPQDADSREWITDLGFALQEVEIEDPLAETRGSIVVAFLEELEKEPQLLAAYAEAVGEDDDITLAVDAAGVEEGVALVRIQHVLRNAGLDPTTVPDVVLVAMDAANAKSQAKAIKVELERRADALLTRRPARLGVQAYDAERLGELKADLSKSHRA